MDSSNCIRDHRGSPAGGVPALCCSALKIGFDFQQARTHLLHNVHKVVEDRLTILAAGLLQESNGFVRPGIRHAWHFSRPSKTLEGALSRCVTGFSAAVKARASRQQIVKPPLRAIKSLQLY